MSDRRYKLSDAPRDGTSYTRQDGDWTSSPTLNSLLIQDSTGTDSLTISHDGTDVNFDHVTTTDWNVNDLTGLGLYDGCVLSVFRDDNSAGVSLLCTTGDAARINNVFTDYLEIVGTASFLGVRIDGYMALEDGITAPATITGYAAIYVDTSDGDLKVKFGDGTVKTIVTDT